MIGLIQKLSNYNIFNYLFPGILFCGLIDRFTQYKILQNNILIDICVYYFIGLCISRIGSLVLEPLLRKAKILNFTSYKDYLTAVEKDKKIESFVEVANMHRTILSMFIIFCMVKIYELISIECQIPFITIAILLLIGFIVLFLCSYTKQSGYITKRIIKANENKEVKNDDN